jgi:hypothetical protein
MDGRRIPSGHLPKDQHLMKSVPSRVLAGACALLALAIPAAAQAAPSYYPTGPQQDVPRSTPADGGWQVCFSDDFSDSSTPVADILSACDGDYLMLAAGPIGSADYQLLAAAPRSDVLFDAGSDYSSSQLSNGSQWYFSDSYSWGFANGGDSVSRGSCDTESTNSALRMCWHTGGGNINYGYRVGDYVTFGTDYDRVVLEPIPVRAVGSPNPLVFADQTQGTVSPRQTVTFAVSAPVGTADADRELGALDTAGANADEFDVVSEDCPEMAPADGSTVTCSARVRFIPQAVGARTADLQFANATGDAVALQGNGVAPPQGAPGTNGVNGTNGTNGTNGVDGLNGAKGDTGPRGPSGRAAKRAVRCSVTHRGRNVRTACTFTKAIPRGWRVQLRDRRGALSTARADGRRTLVFISYRKRVGSLNIRVSHHGNVVRAVRAA